MAELSFSIRVVRSLAAAMKRKRCQETALHKPTTCCHSFDSCHSWFNLLTFYLRTIPHRACRLGESAYSNPCTGSVQIRDNPCSPFHPCSISTKQHDDTVCSHNCSLFLCVLAPLRESTSFTCVLPTAATYCDSFNSSHSWFEYSLIPTSEPFHIAHADSESRPTATRSLFLFDP